LRHRLAVIASQNHSIASVIVVDLDLLKATDAVGEETNGDEISADHCGGERSN
jgi:hypothetical protein